MERFQQIIQKAATSQSEQIDVIAGFEILAHNAGGSEKWPEFGVIDQEFVNLLNAKLFQEQGNHARQAKLTIEGFGDLFLIANGPQLYVFLPNGHHRFNTIWESQSQPEAPAAPAAPPPPPTPGGESSFQGEAPMTDIATAPGFRPEDPEAANFENKPQTAAPVVPNTNIDISAPPSEEEAVELAPPPPTEAPEAPPAAEEVPPEAQLDLSAPPPALDLSTPPPTVAPLEPASETAAPEEPKADEKPAAPPIMAAPSKPFTPPTMQAGVAPLENTGNEETTPAPNPEPAPKNETVIDKPSIDLGVAPGSMDVKNDTNHAQFNRPVTNIQAGPQLQGSEETKHRDPFALEVEGSVGHGPQAIDDILKFMLKKKASDIHLTTGEPAVLRIDGEIHRFKKYMIDEHKIRELFEPITPPMNAKQLAEDNDTDYAYELKGVARFRVNLFRDRNGIGAVLRHIPNDILTFEQLGLPQSIRQFCHLNKGLVVVTGPTGSGKSTTLAAMMDEINNSRSDHILTLEDPIEFVHPQKKCLINQREIHKHTNSFSRALKAALREDPDIILVGELRDLETTAAAMEIAETGHLVMGTLHTTTAVSTIDRIIDQYPSDQQSQIRTMLSESLRGVVAQTLLKKIGGGRCAALEILIVDNAVSSLIREGKTHMIANHMQSQKAKGNQLLNEALMNLIRESKVSTKDAWMKAIDKDGLMNQMRNENMDISWYEAISAA